MRTVEQIVEQIRAAAGGDFAFVLTRKGRLVTHRAPRDMPEEGRTRLVRAARPLVGTDRVIEVTVPREELVPFGGAAPVDVYIGVVAEQAIVCVVMASWADKLRVTPAIEAGMRAIGPLLRRGLPTARRSTADVEPAKGSPYVPERSPSVPPPADSAPFVDLRASLIPEVPRAASLPDITLGEAALGRESLVAVRREAAAGGSAPEITIGEAALGRASLAAIGREGMLAGSLPEISIGEAPLGRESLVAIGREGMAGGSAPEITVSEARLGRETLVAIGREGMAGGSLPEITVSEAPLGRESLAAIRREAGPSAPEITLGQAPLGRESLAAIEQERGPRPRPASSPEGIRVELVSGPDIEVAEGDRLTLPWAEPPAAPAPAGRATLPWVEPPADAKRASDAARLGRKLAPPKVTIKLEEADAAVLEVAKARPTAKRS
ncbi:MAG: hypothetical protein QM820_42115 [Minicystis sp.]